MGRFSTGLVVSEIAVSCALLVGAGFMIKSVINVGDVELGFDPTGVLTGQIGLSEGDYPDEASRDHFFNALKERLEEEAGVTSATLSTHLPGLGTFSYRIGVDGEAYPADSDYPAVNATFISTDYFETFRVELIQGRDFHPLETSPGGDPVVIVNESFANRYLRGGDRLGSRIRLGLSTSEQPWMTVVGIAPDMHVGGGVGGLGDDLLDPERIFIPNGFYVHPNLSVAIRHQGDRAAMASRLREIVAELDPNLPIYDLAPLDEALKKATWAFSLFGIQFSVFGGVALFLAAVGLYGVMAFSVSQRRREMGVRMALGAEGSSILRLILGRGATQLGIGLVVGLGLGAAMGRPLRYALYGVEVGDPAVYLGITITLLAAGFLACILPALTAARTDPSEAMRVN
jgi:predicted permease